LTGERANIAGKITAIIEPTYHDSAVSDSDETEIPEPGSIVCDERAEISIADTIAWAASLPFAAILICTTWDLGL
jgi:hypothetical protein